MTEPRPGAPVSSKDRTASDAVALELAATVNTPADRYLSFCGLDCEARAEQLVAHICALCRQQEADNPFWSQFIAKVDADNAPDALLLVHSTIFYLRDLLQKHHDNDGLLLLDAIESDCC